VGQKIMLNNVRCAFLVLGEPEEFQPGDGKPRWSATALVPYNSETAARVVKTLEEVAKEKWEKKWQAYYEAIMADPKASCWTDGKRKPDYDGFAGHWALSSHRPRDKGRPLVMDTDKSPIYQQDNAIYAGKGGRIYSGCFVNMQVEIWAQENSKGKGLRATLLGIQRFKDGDAFGGGAAPQADDFAEIADGADSDDLT
jgi:hypothetical protein